MTRPVVKLATPSGIGAGQTATLAMPLGMTYYKLFVRMQTDVSGTATDVPVNNWGNFIDEVRLIVDGTVTYQATAETIVTMNKIRDISMVAGSLPILLDMPYLAMIGNRDVTGYKTAGGIDTFTIEIDVKPGVNVSQLRVLAERGPGNGEAFGTHLRVTRHVHPQGLIGTAEIADIPKGPYNLAELMFDTDEIANLEVSVDSRVILDMDAAMRNQMHVLEGRVPQAGFTHVNFLSANRLSEAMPLAVRDFRVKADFTAVGNYNITSVTVRNQL